MNRKLSSFESINAKDINKDLTYVSAVQKLSDGSYKNINIPLAQLSGLWNDDVKTAVANAEVSGSSIDADVIHQAALNAVENALRDAKQSITEAINRANDFIGDMATGNTATQQAIAEANEKVLQEINAGLDRLGEINTLYGNYFGPGGVVEQALNDANNELAISKDLLRDAQAELEALANGEITSTGIKNLEEKVNGLVTLVGLEGQYVDPDGKFANRVYEALNLAMGTKTFMLKNINGEDQTVTTFDQLINTINGIYTTTLSRVNALSGDITNMRSEWDVEKGKMEESISKNNFSDPDNQTVKQAVRTMTADLIEQSVRKAVLDEIETITFLKTDPVGTVREIETPLVKETLYFLTWDKATDKDNPTQLEYQFVVLENGNEQPSNTAYKQLTTEGIRSSVILTSSQSQEQGEEPEEENYTRKLYIRLATALENDCVVSIAKQKYFSQSQISQTVDGVIISAVREELGKHNFSEFQVTDEYIQGVVDAYDLNNNHHFSQLKQDAEHISQSVNTFNTNLANKANKSEVDNSIEALQASIDITDSKIDNTVSSYTCEIIDEWDESNYQKCIDNHQDESNNSIVYKSAAAINGTAASPNNVRCLLGLHQKNGEDIQLKPGHEYFLKIENISKIHYTVLPVGHTIPTIGNVQTDILENNVFTHSTDNSNRINGLQTESVLYFYYESKYNNKTHERVGEPNIQLLESVSSKFANFEITADQIKQTIQNDTVGNGNGVIRQIYQKLSRANGEQTVIGQVGEGFLNQSQVESTATRIASNLLGVDVGDSNSDPIVRETRLEQSLEGIKSDVSKVQYINLKNEGADTVSSNYFGISEPKAFSALNTINTYQKGPEFNIKPLGGNVSNVTMVKIKVPYPNVDYTIFLVDANKYSFHEVHFINAESLDGIDEGDFCIGYNHSSCIYSPNVEGKEQLNPLHFGNVTTGYLSFTIYKDDKTIADSSYFNSNPNVRIKLGIPTDVAVSNIKQTADSISSQVSNLQTTADGLGKTIETAIQTITPGMINSTVAAEVNGKLSGYSTIEQTKDFIASTVGRGGVVINKFNDPLFKNQYVYWHRRYSNYPKYIDFINIWTTQNGQIVKQFTNPALIQYTLSTSNSINNKFEKDIKSFIMCDYNPSMISGLSQAERRHIYGMYTRPKLVSGQKYTASFYIKLANGDYLNSMLNIGLCAELAKQAPTFHIACINTGWTLEQAENQTYDSNHDISVENLGEFNFDNLISNPTAYRLEFANQGNTTGTGFNGSNADDDQFGLWLKFKDDQLGTYMTKIFDSSAPIAQGPTINNNSNIKYRWFKVWFTFTAQDKYIGRDSNGNDVFINHTEKSNRAFCFEPCVNTPASNNFYPLFCEIAAPMLNVGTTPLKFSSEEGGISEQYSEIIQKQNEIQLNVNKVEKGIKNDLKKVGITLDGDNSRIDFYAETAKFTGDIEAKSLAVKPEGSNSSIKLVIYDSSNEEQSLIKSAINSNQDLDISEGTPLLIASNGTDTYLVNLTKLNSGSDGSYWKVKTSKPIGQKILYTGNTWNSESNYITGPSNELTLYYFTNNSVEIYSHKFICESQIDVKSIGHVLYSGISANKYFTSFNYNGSPNSVTIPLQGGSETFNFNDKGYNDDFSRVIKKEPTTVIKEYASARVSYGTYNTPVFELGSFTGNPLYRISSNYPYFSENGKTKCGLTNIGTYRKCRVYRRMDNGVLVDFPEKRYCFIVEKNGEKHFVGFCNYQTFLEKYTEYINSQNPYSNSYGNQYEKQKALGEYFVKDVLYEVSLDKTISQNNNSLEACSINSCKVLFTEYEISNFEEVLNRGALAAISNDYFRKVD